MRVETVNKLHLARQLDLQRVWLLYRRRILDWQCNPVKEFDTQVLHLQLTFHVATAILPGRRFHRLNKNLKRLRLTQHGVAGNLEQKTLQTPLLYIQKLTPESATLGIGRIK